MLKYKILRTCDMSITEDLLNKYASEGYRIVSVVSHNGDINKVILEHQDVTVHMKTSIKDSTQLVRSFRSSVDKI